MGSCWGGCIGCVMRVLEKEIVITLQVRRCPRVGEVRGRDPGPVRPVHSVSSRLGEAGQAETSLAPAQN